MNETDLYAALDRHGGDLGRWPAPLAARARAAETSDAAFAAALREARELDRLIEGALRPSPLPLGYATRVAARAAGAGRTARGSFDPRLIFALGSSWAVAAALAGVIVANLLAPTDPDLLSFAEIAFGATQFTTEN